MTIFTAILKFINANRISFGNHVPELCHSLTEIREVVVKDVLEVRDEKAKRVTRINGES